MFRRSTAGAFVLLTVVAVHAAGAAAYRNHAGQSYDGMVVRVNGLSATQTGDSSVLGCPDSVYASSDTPAPTVIRSVGGSAPTGGTVDVVSHDGDVVWVDGSVQVDGFRVLRFAPPQRFQIGMNAGSCTEFASTSTSAAGDVYSIEWSAPDGETGPGCVAIHQTALTLAATLEVGACDPSTFPSVPPLASVKPRLGMLDGLLIGLSGTAVSTSGSFCTATKRYWGYQPDAGAQILRQPAGLTVLPGSLAIGLEIGVTRNHTAALWSVASLKLALDWPTGSDGVSVPFVLGQTNPNEDFSCRALPTPQSLHSLFAVGVWGGPGHKTYLGKAWLRATIGPGSHRWSVLAAFGKPSFKP